jgi:hypothetical protein
MSKRDVLAIIAHLDAIETRLSARLDSIETRLDRVHEQIAGMLVDHATHTHEGDS